MRVPLNSGAYQARSVIAGAQRCVNLYPEANPADSQLSVPVTHYPTPGVKLMAAGPIYGVGRAAYCATDGSLYVVITTNIYYVDSTFKFTFIGQIGNASTPVSMSDNGLVIVVVDGTQTGYCINMANRQFGTIGDPNFYGADKVAFLDTYFIFNRPGTAQFYISLSEVTFAMLTSHVAGTAFDPLDIAAKAGSADDIQTISVVHGELWLIGFRSAEVWVNTGASDFTFGRLPGAFIEHGCVAKYSVAKQDVSTFWISLDSEGQGLVVRGSGYDVERISTHAIEAEFQSYARIDDAIGFCFQQQGHAFYVLTFPTADKTFAYEIQTGQWHELASTDQNGALRRHRANCCCFAYGHNLILDWQSGQVCSLDPDTFTDLGAPIVRIRTFPHLLDDGKRVSYTRFIADMQVGTLPNATTDDPPMITLRWSDTRGASYGNGVQRSLGSGGDYLTSILWTRLGQARDRVFELSWSAPVKTALQGAFIEVDKRAS